MPAHIHAELMAQYAEDAKTTEQPWLLWEYTSLGGTTFFSMLGTPSWAPDCNFRRKPRVILINGFEVPEPLRVAPPNGTPYFIPALHLRGPSLSLGQTWVGGNGFDCRTLELGLAHLTQEAADAHARALLSFTEVK